jgi:hypothetical protein
VPILTAVTKWLVLVYDISYHLLRKQDFILIEIKLEITTKASQAHIMFASMTKNTNKNNDEKYA